MVTNTGVKGEASVLVTQDNTAEAIGSGALPVFSTPSMIALMELTASKSVSELLDEGTTSVGTSLNIRHVAATPVGMTVRCVSTLTEIDGKRLVFKVEAYDECGLIGEGEHERFIVTGDRFVAKANSKLASKQDASAKEK